MESSLGDMALKVAVFLIVQALVYVILSTSSDIFSKNKMRSFSFKPARSSSINRIIAAISDLPMGSDQLSPSPKTTRAQDQFLHAINDQCSHDS